MMISPNYVSIMYQYKQSVAFEISVLTTVGRIRVTVNQVDEKNLQFFFNERCLYQVFIAVIKLFCNYCDSLWVVMYLKYRCHHLQLKRDAYFHIYNFNSYIYPKNIPKSHLENVIIIFLLKMAICLLLLRLKNYKGSFFPLAHCLPTEKIDTIELNQT